LKIQGARVGDWYQKYWYFYIKKEDGVFELRPLLLDYGQMNITEAYSAELTANCHQ
jgi:hypothetical protein